MTDCVRCYRPVADTGYACHACATRLSVVLLRGARLTGEMVTTVARLDVLGDGGPSSAETSLPFDWDASDATWAIHNTLTTWARHVSETSGRPLPTVTSGCGHHSCKRSRLRQAPGPHCAPVPNPQPARILTLWLAKQVGWLRVRPEAEQAFDELHATIRLLERTVDTHVDRWYAGRCGADTLDEEGLLAPCPQDLYALSGAEWVTCRDCGASFTAEDRKADLLDQVRDHLAIAEEIARALHAWGWPITSAQIRGYAFRNRLLPHSRDIRDRPMYRIGDVVDLLIHVGRKGEKVPA